MSTLAIELNGTGLIVLDESHSSSASVTPSPGFALLDGDRLVTGVAAWRWARVKPRFVYSRFWEELDTTPLPRPFPRKLTRADLVHAHLGEVWSSIRSHVDKVIFVVPGFYTEDQLGLLLGISRSGNIPVSGLVDSAVAASALGFPGNTLLHIDLHLHRVVATKVRQTDGLQRGRIEWNGKLGLLDLYDAWVKVIAQSFVRETRFDPLHLAETEQVLYKRLPQWLQGLCHQEAMPVSVEGGGKTYSIELSQGQVVRTATPLYERVAQLLKSLKSVDEPTTVLLSHRLVELPGLEAHLSADPDISMTPLSSVAAAAGALARKDQIQCAESSDELTFVTQLLLGDSQRRESKPPTVAGVVSGPGDERIPTHILHEGIAHPLSAEPFVLGLAIPKDSRGLNVTAATAGISRTHCRIYRLEDQVFVEDESSYGSFINGKRINGKASVVAGDLLRLGSPGVELQLIAVVEGDGTP